MRATTALDIIAGQFSLAGEFSHDPNLQSSWSAAATATRCVATSSQVFLHCATPAVLPAVSDSATMLNPQGRVKPNSRAGSPGMTSLQSASCSACWAVTTRVRTRLCTGWPTISRCATSTRAVLPAVSDTATMRNPQGRVKPNSRAGSPGMTSLQSASCSACWAVTTRVRTRLCSRWPRQSVRCRVRSPFSCNYLPPPPTHTHTPPPPPPPPRW